MGLKWNIAQAAEIRWWKQYLKNQSPEKYLFYKIKYWNNLLADLQPDLKKKMKILDAGCGPAGIFMILQEYDVDAIDPLLDRYESDLEHFQKANYPGIRFFNSTLERFNPSQKYDLIFCLNAINHVTDIKESIIKLSSLLKQNSLLYISTDAHKYSFLKYLFRLLPGDILHPHQYDVREYRKLLEDQGFKMEAEICLKESPIFDYYLFVARKL